MKFRCDGANFILLLASDETKVLSVSVKKRTHDIKVFIKEQVLLIHPVIESKVAVDVRSERELWLKGLFCSHTDQIEQFHLKYVIIVWHLL